MAGREWCDADLELLAPLGAPAQGDELSWAAKHLEGAQLDRNLTLTLTSILTLTLTLTPTLTSTLTLVLTLTLTLTRRAARGRALRQRRGAS